jgi:L-iditol 2-dehydrogenase
MSKALQYKFSIPNYVRVRAADKLPGNWLESGKIPGLSEIERAPVPLPSPAYARLKPILCGVCGSDISALTNRSGPALTPFSSFPFTPGHEVVAEIVELGSEAAEIEGISVGQRVVLNPIISCYMRGLDPCRMCRTGQPGLCIRAAEGSLAPGMLTGFCRDLPGGWSTDMVAHWSQLVPVPDEFSDELAVLIEPFSVAVHAVLKDPPPPDAKVLIIGSGSIGLFVLAALRMMGVKSDITILARHPLQAEMAAALGADNVLRGETAGDAAVRIAGAKKYKTIEPIKGKPTYAGGFDWVYDCVGSNSSVDDSLRVAGPHGHIVMVGCAAEMSHLDLSFLWNRELQVTGCYVYGKENGMEGKPHTFRVAMDMIAGHPGVDLARLITHKFPLDQWQEAMQVSLARGKHGAIKVVFDVRN